MVIEPDTFAVADIWELLLRGMEGKAIMCRFHPFGEYGLLGDYREHSDHNQANPFFGLLKECVDKGIVSEDMQCEGMCRYHDRHDAFEVPEQTPDLAPPGNPSLNLPVALARPRKPAVN